MTMFRCLLTKRSPRNRRGRDKDNATVSGQENTQASEHKHELIEGVWCLRCCNTATLDIVFVSGPRTEWRARSGDKILWPGTWLPEHFPKARVLVLEVDFNSLQIWEVAINSVQCLQKAEVGTRPYFLVGHSLGGLLAKEVLLRADATYPNDGVALKCKGVVFYGVPQLKAYTDSALKAASKIMGIDALKLKPYDEEKELRINLDYQPLQLLYPAYYFIEGKPTEKVIICPKQSAAYCADASRVLFLNDSDHLEICRPESKTSLNFALLVDFIKKQGLLSTDDRRQPRNNGRLWPKEQKLQGDLQDYVGLEKKVRETKKVIEPMLRSEDSSVLGLAFNGMCGIGKTTLAAAFYDDEIVDNYFTHCAWVEVGLQPSKASICKQQAWLFKQLSGEEIRFLDPRTGAAKLRTWMSEHKSEKILIVLDDVWNWEQTTGDYSDVPLVGKDVPSGSCLILTTRKMTVVRASQAKCHRLNLLDEQEALDLLYLTAGIQKSDELEPVLKEVATRCQNLPLALSTLGNLGRAEESKSEVFWWETVSTDLKKKLPDKVSRAFKQDFSEVDGKLQLVFLLVIAFLPSSKGRLAAYLSALLNESENDVFQYVRRLSDRGWISCDSLDGSREPQQWSLSCEDAASSGIGVHNLFRDVALSQLEPGKLANGRRSVCFERHFIIWERDVAVKWEKVSPAQCLSCLPTLTSFVVTGCRLSCPVPSEFEELCALTKLTYLDLTHKECNVFCTIPPGLSALRNLTVLHSHSQSCEISGPVPPELSNLPVLHSHSQSCEISGPILPELSNLTVLHSHSQSWEICGPISPELSALRNLTCLDLNKLSGSIPTQLAALTNLTYLNLNGNKLGASIPPISPPSSENMILTKRRMKRGLEEQDDR